MNQQQLLHQLPKPPRFLVCLIFTIIPLPGYHLHHDVEAQLLKPVSQLHLGPISISTAVIDEFLKQNTNLLLPEIHKHGELLCGEEL